MRSVVALAVGERRAEEILAPLGINDNRVLGLTDEQRAAILAAVGEQA